MSAFEELQCQLLDSVAARARVTTFAGLGRWWRGVGSRALVVAVPVVLALAAATLLLRVGAGPREPGGLVLQASAIEETSCPPCQAVGGRLHAPLGGQTTAGAAGPAHSARAVQVRRGLPVVRWGPMEELSRRTARSLVG